MIFAQRHLAIAVLPALWAAPAFAQATPEGVPAPPPIPSSIRFADELAGRELLFATQDAYRNAPALRFSVKWTERTQRGARVAATTGVETVASEPKARRIALTTETTAGGGKEIRRVIAGGGALLATRYQLPRANATPTREFVRLTLGPDDTLASALRQVQAAPRTWGAELATQLGGRVRGTVWRGTSGDAVWEIEPARRQRYGNIEFSVLTTHHYLIDPKTRRLRRYERWTRYEAANAAARRPENARADYRREEYDAAQTASAPLPAALFATSPPPGYKETALPDAPPAAAPAGPREADAEARRLLLRWAQAQERLLTYFAEIEVSQRQEPNPDPTARPLPDWARNEQRVLYTVWLHRPGRARLTEETPPGQRQQARSLLAVSDGQRLSVHNRLRGQPQIRPLNNPDALAAELNRAGFGAGPLGWLLNAPDLGADRAAYRGRQTLGNGETTEVVELVRTQVTRPQGQPAAEVTRTTTVFLGADGLPRRIEERRARSVVGVLARDQPGAQVTTIQYRDARVDAQPPQGTFTVTPPARTVAADGPISR